MHMLSLVPAPAAGHLITPWAWGKRQRFADAQALMDFGRAQGTPGVHVHLQRRAAPFHYDLWQLEGPAGGLSSAVIGCNTAAHSDSDHPTVYIAAPPGSSYRAGRCSQQVGAGPSLVLLPAYWDVTRVHRPGRVLGFSCLGASLDAELQARAGDGTLPALQLRVLAVTADCQARWLDAAATYAAVHGPDADPRARAQAHARLVELLATALLSGGRAARVGTLAPARLQRVEEWVEANLAEPVTLGMLCQVAGVGERALQKAFLQRRGRSPLRYLAERRVLRAQQLLAMGAPGATVTGVALAVGASHVGRFAQMYAEVLAERPSDTLARARAARAGVAPVRKTA